MGVTGVVAVMLVAGVCHAGWNLVAKQVDTDRALLLVGCSVLIAVVLLPWGVTHIPAESLVPAFACVVVRGTLNMLYLVGLSRSYQLLDLSLAYPLVRGIGPVVATLLAVLLLHERPAAIGLLGVAVTSLAILALALGARAPRHERRLRADARTFAVVVLTGLTIGAYTVVDKVAVGYWNPVAYFWAIEVVSVCWATAVLGWRGRLGALRATMIRHTRSAALCAVLIGTSYVLALFALQHALASYIAPLREMSVLFAVLLGMLVLKEDHGPRRLVATAGIACGLVLVSLAL